MDLNAAPPTSPDPQPQPEPPVCSICFDPVLPASPGTRGEAKLTCRHTFHLDCLGSAFNAKGIMQCPNCRHAENGHWLYANGPPSTDSDSHFGNGVTRGTYQVISGPGSNINRIMISSATMEAHQLLSELLRQPTIDGSIPLYSVFRNLELQSISYRTTGMEGDPTFDLSNTQVFYGSEPRNTEIEQHYLGTIPMVDFVNRPTAPFGFQVPRYGGSNQRHSTQPTAGSGSSTVAALGPSPAVTSRDHGRHRLMRGHVQQTVPLATRSRPYPISRRSVRPRAVSIASSIAASYRAEDRELHDIYRARAPNLQNIIHNQENASRRVDQAYTHLLGQWRPSAEPAGNGSSQHNQENSSFPSGLTSELPPEFRSGNGYLSGPSNWRRPFL